MLSDIESPKEIQSFLCRYYRWAQADFANEIDTRFATLSSVKCKEALNVCEFMRGLDKSSRYILASALVKKKHAKAVKVLSESLTAAEAEVLQKFVLLERGRGSGPYFAPSASSAEEAAIIQDLEKGRFKSIRINKQIRATIVAQLRPILGEPCKNVSAKLEYVCSLGLWKIHTVVDFGGTLPLYYVHLLTTELDTNFLERISLLRWLGISSQTHWSWLIDRDILDTVSSLANMCGRFMRGVSEFLNSKSNII